MERVKILGLRGGGVCCGSGGREPTIKRDYPSILNRTGVDTLRWLSFCNRIDDALKPILVVKRQVKTMIQFLFGSVTTLIIVLAILITQTEIEKYLGKLWYFYAFAAVYIVPLIIFFRIRGILSRKMRQVYDEVNAVCLDTTNQSSGVRFELLTIRKTNGKKIWYDRFIAIYVDGLITEADNNTTSTRSGSISIETPLDEFTDSPV